MRPISESELMQTLVVLNNTLELTNHWTRLAIDKANSGYQLQIVVAIGVKCITPHMPRKDLYQFMLGYLEALEAE